MREKRLAFLTVAVTLSIVALLLEAALRFFPVATGLFAQPVNTDAPIFHFQSNRPYIYSKGWNFRVRNRGRVNNAGFVNEQNYDTAGEPLYAVVGDSYVEALMVPYPQTLHGRLADELAGDGRVYSFAASGAPLSQYLVWARHARDVYQAVGFIFVIVGNDFDESMMSYKAGPGFHHFVNDGTALRLQRVDNQPGNFRALVRGSALARYLVFNLEVLSAPAKLERRWNNRGQAANAEKSFVGQTMAQVSSRRLRDSQLAVDAFMAELREMQIPAERVLFVLDGLRPHLYDAPALAYAQTTYFGLMRDYVHAAARQQGYTLIDMQPLFIDQHEHSGARFESAWDAHWNGAAHGLAADAIMRTNFLATENL